MSIEYFRKDPIFELKTPLLFAHRGGALEVPESTVMGFNHALNEAKADVLELDVQLTCDGEFVVWHGPRLDNVRIEGENNCPAERPRERRKIYHYNWNELNKKAWVANPEVLKLKSEEKIFKILDRGVDGIMTDRPASVRPIIDR
jgi:glycerophosphoryl diester phosphodiesterase